jgi:hypothetical protein
VVKRAINLQTVHIQKKKSLKQTLPPILVEEGISTREEVVVAAVVAIIRTITITRAILLLILPLHHRLLTLSTAVVLVSLLCPKLIQNFIIPSPTLNSLQYHHKQIGSKIDTLQILALKLPRK